MSYCYTISIPCPLPHPRLLRPFIQMLVQRQESEQELNQRLQKNQADKQALQERIASLQRSLANAESEKRDIGRNQVRLDKDNNALKKTLGKVRKYHEK